MIDPSNYSELIHALKDHLDKMIPSDRLVALAVLTDDFCPDCGRNYEGDVEACNCLRY